MSLTNVLLLVIIAALYLIVVAIEDVRKAIQRSEQNRIHSEF